MIKIKTVYQSKDGKVFESMYQCLKDENDIKIDLQTRDLTQCPYCNSENTSLKKYSIETIDYIIESRECCKCNLVFNIIYHGVADDIISPDEISLVDKEENET